MNNKISKFFFVVLLAVVCCSGCKNNNNTEGENNNNKKQEENDLEVNPTKVLEKPTIEDKYLLLNEDGSYGGSLNKDKYGTGAPLNGANDHEDTVYYTRHDFYNMKCTDGRTLIPHFQPYQQVMEDTSGIACVLMVLQNDNQNTENNITETSLMEEYESVNAKKVYGSGTSVVGLENLLSEYGFKTESNSSGSDVLTSYDEFSGWVTSQLLSNHYILVRYQDGMKFNWHVIIGIDNMNSTEVEDDVLIFADPLDRSDHYQDGYSVYHLKRFYHWWLKSATNGDKSKRQEYILVESNYRFDFQYDNENDPVKTYPEVPEHHMLLNKNGTVGGAYGDGRYSAVKEYRDGIVPTKENLGQLDYSYYAYPDYYNYEDTATRQICTNYRAFKQTMKSSCGICSVMTVLNYYGFDWSTVGKYITRKDFVGYDKDTMPSFGGVEDDDNGRKQEAIVMIYSQGDSALKDVKYTLENCKFCNYGGVGAGNLSKVPSKLGYSESHGSYSGSTKDFSTYTKFKEWVLKHLQKDEPMVVSWNPTGGHWETIIGYDTMGTDTLYDDVIVLADSSDGVDHYIDGYNTLPGHVFYGTWFNGSGSNNQQRVVISRK